MEKKFTPGNWEVDFETEELKGDRVVLGLIYGSSSDHCTECVANAHLIASAPRMLEALEEVVKMYDLAMSEIISSIDTNNETQGSKRMEYPEEQPQITNAKAAINKAYGRQ